MSTQIPVAFFKQATRGRTRPGQAGFRGSRPLPERLSPAKSRQLSHRQFLEQLLADEVSRRDARSAAGRAARAGLLPLMRLETWTEPENLIYDRQLLSDL